VAGVFEEEDETRGSGKGRVGDGGVIYGRIIVNNWATKYIRVRLGEFCFTIWKIFRGKNLSPLRSFI
jgi:hypothetical protein